MLLIGCIFRTNLDCWSALKKISRLLGLIQIIGINLDCHLEKLSKWPSQGLSCELVAREYQDLAPQSRFCSVAILTALGLCPSMSTLFSRSSDLQYLQARIIRRAQTLSYQDLRRLLLPCSQRVAHGTGWHFYLGHCHLDDDQVLGPEAVSFTQAIPIWGGQLVRQVFSLLVSSLGLSHSKEVDQLAKSSAWRPVSPLGLS